MIKENGFGQINRIVADRHPRETRANNVLPTAILLPGQFTRNTNPAEIEGVAEMFESLSTEQLEFIKAIENYKNEKKKLFLSWSEVLNILKNLGYQKVAARPENRQETACSADKPASTRPDRLARSIEACKAGMTARTSN